MKERIIPNQDNAFNWLIPSNKSFDNQIIFNGIDWFQITRPSYVFRFRQVIKRNIRAANSQTIAITAYPMSRCSPPLWRAVGYSPLFYEATRSSLQNSARSTFFKWRLNVFLLTFSPVNLWCFFMHVRLLSFFLACPPVVVYTRWNEFWTEERFSRSFHLRDKFLRAQSETTRLTTKFQYRRLRWIAFRFQITYIETPNWRMYPARREHGKMARGTRGKKLRFSFECTPNLPAKASQFIRVEL